MEPMQGMRSLFLTTMVTVLMVVNVIVEGSFVPPPPGNLFEVNPFVQQSYHGYQYGYHQFPFNSYHHQYHHSIENKPKAIPAVVPVSPVFDVEVMKPSAQLEEKKTVTLYIVPQNSLHVFPHAQQQKAPVKVRLPPLFAKYQGTLPLSHGFTSISPGHIPAVEVPLEKPMVIGSSEAQVLAPAGFTVLLNGPYGAPLTYPIETFALLAPVPVGTIISPATPVVLTTIYAVPRLPSLPSSIKILAEFSKPGQQGSLQQVGGPPGQIPDSPHPHPHHNPFLPVSIHHDLSTSTFVPQSPDKESVTVTTTSDGQGGLTEFVNFPSTVPTPPTSGQQISSGRDPQTSIVPPPPPSGIVSGTAPDFDYHIHNSKEAPYLTQLREESLKRQIYALQKQLENLQAARA